MFNPLNYMFIMKKSLRIVVVSKLVLLIAGFFGVTTLSASITAFNNAIGNPSDGGSGPGIWYSDFATSDLNTLGSDSDDLRNFSRFEARTDFYGNNSGAFGLNSEQTSGSGISGSAGTSYLTGDTSTAVLTFQTPSAFTQNSAILGRRPSGSVAGESKFELFLLSSGMLRVTTGDTQFGVNTNMGTLQTDTWYYVAVSWDLNLDTNQVSYYFGEMGADTLNSGFVNDVSVVGSTDNPIRIAGRSNSDLFDGSLQNIAIYDRALSSAAINDQFSAIPEPSHYAGIFGLLAMLIAWRRRKAL